MTFATWLESRERGTPTSGDIWESNTPHPEFLTRGMAGSAP